MSAEEKGRTAERIEVAKRLLMKKMATADVVEMTGLTVEEIEKLR